MPGIPVGQVTKEVVEGKRIQRQGLPLVAMMAMEDCIHLVPFLMPVIRGKLIGASDDMNSKALLLNRLFNMNRNMSTVKEVSVLGATLAKMTAIDPKELMKTEAWTDLTPQTDIELVVKEPEVRCWGSFFHYVYIYFIVIVVHTSVF